MSPRVITVSALFTLASCKMQVEQNNATEESKPGYEVISDTTISIGENISILHFKPTAGNNYLLYLRTNPWDEIQKRDYLFLKINSRGDSVSSFPVYFENFLTDYIELDDYYYVVTTHRITMGGYTKDFLNKFDKNWNLIWSKKLDKPKYPTGSTVLTLTDNNEILLVSDEIIPKTNKMGVSIRLYSLDGKLISENLILANGHCNPVSLIKSSDDNFYLTAEHYDKETDNNSLWLIKLRQNGDTIWTKEHSHFSPKQVILTKSGDLVFYGSNYSSPDEKETHYHYLKIINLNQDGNLSWQKDIKQNYYEQPGNFVETKDSNYLFISSVTTVRNTIAKAFLFELDKNGELTFARKYDYSPSFGSTPFIIRTEGQITMIGQKKRNNNSGTFNDVIQIIKLTE